MKIYIGNMSYSTTEDQLRQAFETYGDVSDVNVVMDRDSGRPKGFAFVEMPNPEEGKAAIAALNGKEIDGRTLNVDEARPRQEKTGGGGGGRDRRGGGGGGYRRGW